MSRDADLVGRDDELRAVARLLGHARNGRGGALLLTGSPGIGKTALLDRSLAQAHGVRILRVDGFESEAGMPFAAVHRLTLELKEHRTGLRQRLREALDVASGDADGPAPDRFLVGLGVLGLLAAEAATTPVVCAVDDAHLLDAESLDVLAFVARRLHAEPVGLLFAARDEANLSSRVAGLPELVVAGLDPEAAVTLLARSLPAPVDPAAAAAIARATGGNPLALIDLAEELSAQELSGLGLGEEPIPVGRHLEAHYVSQVRSTGLAVQGWMLLAATETTGDVDLISAAAALLDLPAEAQDDAETEHLVEVRDAVRFRHPLVRSAVYNAAGGVERRRTHRALASAARSAGRVELEAWHTAKATVGTDPDVAASLERAADFAGRRGGFASRAGILSRAAELTPAGPARDARLVGAAEAALAVGAAQVAAELLDRIDGELADRVSRGRMIVVRCALGIFAGDPSVVMPAASMLVRAADEFQGIDPDREVAALLKAFEACVAADSLMAGVSRLDLGKRMELAARTRKSPSAPVLAGLAAFLLLPYDEAVGPARAALDAILAQPDDQLMHVGTALAALGTFLWDERARDTGLERATVAARDAGALAQLDVLLWIASLAQLTGGTVRSALDSMDGVREVRRAMGYDAENVINAALMAWTGEPRHVVLAIADGANSLGYGGVGSAAVAAVALRELADGSYRDAYERLHPLMVGFVSHVTPTQFPDFVEAAVRSGHGSEAEPYADRLFELAAASGSRWCLGVAERSRALLADTRDAETHHAAAVRHLEGTGALTDLGRAHLVYGEWLRRAKRRHEAIGQLELALSAFDRSGAVVFCARTQRELEAAGARPTAVAQETAQGTPSVLTTQELTVARLAGTGHTNPEIAARLFISPNTVDYHLRKVFAKLGVSSRRQLSDRLSP